VLSEAMSLPKEAALPIVSRIKLMADLDVSERRIPQNGRIGIARAGSEYDLRVTTVPAVFGEAFTARILDQSSVLVGLDRLGMSADTQTAFENAVRAPSGMVVVSGPQGSGRTTTLYSCLTIFDASRLKILTIEDPVEYRLRNVTQVHVNRKVNLTPAAAMRTFQRSDPDVILVGDLRDLDTAEACLNAAMTGHLVLTSLLPSESSAAVVRLIEMGLEPFMVSSSLSAVLAQRLVRCVCPDCKEPYQPSADLLRRLEVKTGLDLAKATFYRGKGCSACNQFGYKHRTGIFELLRVDERIRELIAKPATTEELRAAAVDNGMTTLLKDGVLKAMEGVTTLEEVLRVLAAGWSRA